MAPITMVAARARPCAVRVPLADRRQPAACSPQSPKLDPALFVLQFPHDAMQRDQLALIPIRVACARGAAALRCAAWLVAEALGEAIAVESGVPVEGARVLDEALEMAQ